MPELNDMELGFLNSSNDILSRYIDKIRPDKDEFSGEIEPEKKRNDSGMEISEDGGEYTEEDANSEYDLYSGSGEHEGLIMMNQTSRKLYHQKIKEIKIPLLMTYIISWR